MPGAAKGSGVSFKGKSGDSHDAGQGNKKVDPPKVKGMTHPQATVAVPVSSSEPSTLHVNIAKHPMTHSVGDSVEFEGNGKVTRVHHDDMGSRMSLEIHHVASKSKKK